MLECFNILKNLQNYITKSCYRVPVNNRKLIREKSNIYLLTGLG